MNSRESVGPDAPQPITGTILITGGAGFVGRNLVEA